LYETFFVLYPEDRYETSDMGDEIEPPFQSSRFLKP